MTDTNTTPDPVLVEFDNGIAFVTLNRPEKRNAMNPKLNVRMLEVLDELDADDRCGVLVLRGARGVLAARLIAQLCVRLVFVVHALLEFLDRRAEILGTTGQALGAEHQQDDGEHDQPMPDAETAHKSLVTLVIRLPSIAHRL